MIIVQLTGGLGNQLFQYAIGRNIAERNNVPLKLDLSWFKDQSDRSYGLNHFATIQEIASPAEVAQLKGSKLVYLKEIILHKLNIDRPHGKRTLILERSLDFDPNILQISGSAYLIGFWQSEKYFKDIERTIRKEFVIKTPPDSKNIAVANEIKNTEAVCIHVRRGDYVSDPKTSRSIGVCSLDYYYKSLDHIMSKVEKPHFFIFSNDPDWTQRHIKIDAPTTYVCHNPSDMGFEDLRLMTFCKHFIIANSSFSWWGAWLSSNKQKTVIAPAQWFKGQQYNDEDRLPKEWIRL